MILQESSIRRRFAVTAGIALAGVLVWLNLSEAGVPAESRFWSAMIYFLAALPAIRWALYDGEGYPAFQVLCLSLIPTQAVPLLTKAEELRQFGDDVVRMAALVVVAFQITLITVHGLVKARPRTSPFWIEPIVTKNIAQMLSTTLTISTLYFIAATFFIAVPQGLEGPLRAIFSGLSAVSVYTLSNYLSGGELPRALRTPLIINIVVQALTFASGLIMVQGITLTITALLGYLSRAKRVPWIALTIVVSLIALLHAGKSVMREKYWADGGRARSLRIVDLPAFYSEWIQTSVAVTQMSADDATAKSKDNNKLLQRSSLFHMLCLVVEYSPSRQSFLYGETYSDIPAQFVPRFFWPDKPTVHVSTSRLGIYYGLQDAEATLTTTIAFGFIAEAWANFGLVGCVVLGALLGAVHKTLWVWTRDSQLFSPAGILMITFTAWSSDTGQTISVWTSSFYQAALVLLVSTVVLKQFFNG